MSRPWRAPALFAAVLALGCAPSAEPPIQDDAAVEALLRLHHEQRVAHVLRASDRLFTAARFLEWEDVAPPMVRVADDGSLATVAVEKRVRVLVETEGQPLREDARRFTWVGTWQREAGDWQLVGLASTDRPEDDPDPTLPESHLAAYAILHAARDAVGGQAAVAAIATVSLAAECDGPRGPFTTAVRSARDGRVVFVQRFAEPALPDRARRTIHPGGRRRIRHARRYVGSRRIRRLRSRRHPGWVRRELGQRGLGQSALSEHHHRAWLAGGPARGRAIERMGIGARGSVLLTLEGEKRVDSLIVAWPSGAVDRTGPVPGRSTILTRKGDTPRQSGVAK